MNSMTTFAFSLVVAGEALAAAPAYGPQSNEPLAIVIYDQPGLKGRSVTVTKPVSDLRALKFDDQIASFTIVGAGDWVLCEDRNYAGRCMRVQVQADDLALLRLAGRVSSLYPAPAQVAP